MAEMNEEKRFRGEMCMGILSTKYWSTELIATPERLILKGPRKYTYELPVEKIERIEKAELHIWFLIGLLFGSIRIYHTVEGYPERLMFTAWRVKADKLLEELRGMGYKIIKN